MRAHFENDQDEVLGKAYDDRLVRQLIPFIRPYTKSVLLALRFFDTHPVGSLMSRMTNDVDALNDLLTQGMVSILGDVVTLTGIVIVLFVLNWRLALVGLAVLPIIAVASRYFQIAMRTIY